MSRPDATLAEVLEPVRDLAVGELLSELARALERGDARHEPMIRDARGQIVREGALHLPRRADLAVTQGGRTVARRVTVPRALAFEPVTVARADGFTAIVAPFRWDSARLVVECSQQTMNWTPVRLWFLEAFQSRYSDLSPDLDGVVHCLTGPTALNGAWQFEVDFGSAPVEAFSEMLDAFARCEAERVIVGTVRPRPPVQANGA